MWFEDIDDKWIIMLLRSITQFLERIKIDQGL